MTSERHARRASSKATSRYAVFTEGAKDAVGLCPVLWANSSAVNHERLQRAEQPFGTG
jgi:hypothetical protein